MSFPSHKSGNFINILSVSLSSGVCRMSSMFLQRKATLCPFCLRESSLAIRFFRFISQGPPFSIPAPPPESAWPKPTHISYGTGFASCAGTMLVKLTLAHALRGPWHVLAYLIPSILTMPPTGFYHTGA